MPELVAPPKTIAATFALEPALNAIISLDMLNHVEQFSGLAEWAYQTTAALSSEQLRVNKLVFRGHILEELLGSESWSSFPAFLDELEESDPFVLRDRALDTFLNRAEKKLESEVPAAEQLLADRAIYLSLIEQLYCCKGQEESYDRELYKEVHGLLSDPPAARDLAVTHLRAMWDDVLAAEWKRNLPMLQESVAAFQALDFTGTSCAEIVRRVTGRELVDECEEWQEEFSRIEFIPSAHLGPYVSMTPVEETMKLAFGARVPKGIFAASPALSRSELLMRLNALADETRLRILELLADEGESSSQEIMEQLDLSQSAASRHLRQLAATGYLTVERRDGAKSYRVSRERIDDTFDALKKSVR